jgi:hypothetical protein
MLYTQTVKGELFELLKILMNDSCLNSFILAGGTALALYMGHRKNVDIDLLSKEEFALCGC